LLALEEGYLPYERDGGIGDRFALEVADQTQRHPDEKLVQTYPLPGEKVGIYRLDGLESGLVRRELAEKPLEQAGLVE
jgi:hypothetical protein